MRHYFAYGSNMDRAHMAKLCPRAEALGTAVVREHCFFIAHSGYGSVARKRNSLVCGVLWKIAARDIAALDAYEAVGEGLYRHAVLPVHFGGKLLRALVYVAMDARPGRASARYRATVLNAAGDWALPEEYVRLLETEMVLS
jgi:gamma-glutamylcyclotransferase (GGCT)/AIG2-like uncharacterized protein YtfP